MKMLTGRDVRLKEVGLYELIGAERDAVLDALTSGEELPYVLVADKVVCTGGFNLARIADSLQ